MELRSKRAKLEAGGESKVLQDAFTVLQDAVKKLERDRRKLQEDRRRVENDRQKVEEDARKLVKDRQKVEEDRKAAEAKIAPYRQFLDIYPVSREKDYYNAVFYGENNEILGRTFVTDVKDLLAFAKVVYDWRCLDIYRKDGNALCGPFNPIHIFKRSKEDTLVLFDDQTNYTRQALFITPETTEKGLRKDPYFSGKLFSYDDKYSYMASYEVPLVELGIGERSIITLTEPLRGGGMPLYMLDIGGRQVSGKGKPLTNPRDDWHGFTEGLNIIGHCGRLECPSRNPLKTKEPKIPLRFDNSRLHATYRCPKCEEYSLKPVNFLVAGARSRFIFRESGQDRVKYALLQSNGPFPNYVKLAKTNDTVEYDSVQVMTCQLYESPFRCMLCAQMIKLRESELKKACGHYYHKTCISKTTDCSVCQAKFVSEKKMKAIMQRFKSS